MFLTHCGNKSQWCWIGNYISCVIISHTTEDVTVTSLLASPNIRQVPAVSKRNHVKLKTVAYDLCQIKLKQKLSCKFKKWRKLSNCITAKSHKKKAC
jgi:hypothetical protein